jgi:hypothetical protein
VSAFFDDFQEILRKEINKINASVEKTVPNYLYARNVLTSKMSIYSFFHSKLLSIIERRGDVETVEILRETTKFMLEANELLSDLITKLSPKIEEKLDSYKSQCEEMLRLSTNTTTEMEELKKELLNSEEEKRFILSQHEQEKNLLIDKISKSENENRIMTEKLLQKAKILSIDPEKQLTPVTSKSALVVNRSSINIGSTEIQTNNKNFKSATNTVIGPVGSRVLTKKMLTEIIEEIYISKTNFDKKCIENKMARETMEQHMYTYLNQKYGLKNLIIEWATAIINGIRMFSPEDSDVCLFGKILRNELEEESRIVIAKLKSTIYELLLYFLKAKYPLKTSSDIKELANSKTLGFLHDEEWKGIVRYLYENDDGLLVESKINEFIKKKYFNQNNKMEVGNKKLTREELNNLSKVKEDLKILYSDFSKVTKYNII